jgi:hypothetical protein
MKRTLLILSLSLMILSCSKTDNPKAIPGIAPTDVYLNMEKQGFVTTKNLSSDLGNTWENSKSVDGIDYRVVTFSNDVNSVESITANFTALPPKSSIDAKQFLIYICSSPYTDSDPQTAANWIEENYNINNATTIIGPAKFTLSVPSGYARVLRIEKL